MERTTSQCRVRQWFYCTEDINFSCCSCSRDMCFQFKEKHLYDVETAYHNIIQAPAPKQEICIRHENMNYDWYCYSCELPACIRCADHRNHDIVTLGTAYITQQEKHKKTRSYHEKRDWLNIPNSHSKRNNPWFRKSQ